MSLAACEIRVAPAAFALDGVGGVGARCGAMAFSTASAGVDKWLAQQEAAIRKEPAKNRDGQFDIWASIQSKEEAGAGDPPAPYVHPLVRRSRSSLSQRSLEICTESLGSETGSDGTFSSDHMDGYFSTCKALAVEELVEAAPEVVEHVDMGAQEEEEEEEEEKGEHVELPPPLQRRKELGSVNYHCSIGRRSPARSFPPPLPSICRRDGPCLGMRRYRREGRLVVEAVPVPSQNYLHAQRQGGRLVLSFIDTTFHDIYPESEVVPIMEQGVRAEAEVEDGGALGESVAEEDAENDDVADDEEMGEEEGEEEVEVVDKGIVVEVKVSGPPLPQSGGLKVPRTSVVINKFVGMPLSNHSPWTDKDRQLAAVEAYAMAPPPRRPASSGSTTTTTTATAVVAMAAAASSSLSTGERYWRSAKGPLSAQREPFPEKLFFTSKRLMNRQDLLHQVRWCSERHRPLFILEPCCIATS